MTEPPPEPPEPPAAASGDPRFEFECARTWDSLDPTRDPDVRHCDTCRHLVHRVHSDATLQEHGRRGHCVALLPDPYVWPARAMRTGRPRAVLPGAGTAWLTVLTGPDAGRVLELRGADVTIGRGPADLVLDDPRWRRATCGSRARWAASPATRWGAPTWRRGCWPTGTSSSWASSARSSRPSPRRPTARRGNVGAWPTATPTKGAPMRARRGTR